MLRGAAVRHAHGVSSALVRVQLRKSSYMHFASSAGMHFISKSITLEIER